jgi:hypothetical protein
VGLFRKRTSSNALPGRRLFTGESRTPASQTDRQHVFARNRTLTGSTSTRLSGANKYADLQSPRTQAHHLALHRRKIGLVFLGVIASATLLFALLMQFTASVTISVSDTSISKKIDSQLYEKTINEYLGIHPLSRLRFMFDEAHLRNYLITVVPEVVDVAEISMGSIGETNVALTMRRPVAGWTINSRQYFVDSHGVAYERNYYENPSVQIVDNSGVALEQGTTVASNRFLGFVGRIVALSKERGYIVTQAIIPSGTTRQLEVVLQDVVPHVRLSIDRPAGEQVEDMARALVYLSSRNSTPSYIDVRVSGKAFYR